MFIAIKSFFETIGKLFDFSCLLKEKQIESEVIRDKRTTEKNACKCDKKADKQEDLLLDMAEMLRKYESCMSKGDKFRVKVYISKIKKVN